MWGLDQQLPSASMRAMERGPFHDRRPPDPARLPGAVTAHESLPQWAAADIQVCPAAAGVCVGCHEQAARFSSCVKLDSCIIGCVSVAICLQALKTPENVIRAPAVSDGETSLQQSGLQAFLSAEARQPAGRRVGRSKALLEVLLSPPCANVLCTEWHAGNRSVPQHNQNSTKPHAQKMHAHKLEAKAIFSRS